MATKRISALTTKPSGALASTDMFPLEIATGSNETYKLTAAEILAYIRAAVTASPVDIVLLTDTQTMTNKTLTNPKINENVAMTALATDLNLLAGLAAAGLTATELGYIKTLTSDAQAQLTAVTPAFGEIYVAGGASAQTVAKTTWTKLTPFATNGEYSSGITVDQANDKITIATNGVYRLNAQLSFISSDDALTNQFAIYRDGTILANSEVRQYHITGANITTVYLSCIYKEGAASKDYDIRYYHNSASDNDITISYANFSVQRISS